MFNLLIFYFLFSVFLFSAFRFFAFVLNSVDWPYQCFGVKPYYQPNQIWLVQPSCLWNSIEVLKQTQENNFRLILHLHLALKNAVSKLRFCNEVRTPQMLTGDIVRSREDWITYLDLLLVRLHVKSVQFVRLRWFFSIAMRIPTAQDFRVISAGKWVRARTERKKFPSS